MSRILLGAWAAGIGLLLSGVGSGSCRSIAFRDIGMTIMKMINSTSMTSIIGVTFGSAFTPPLPPADIAMRASPYCEMGELPAVAVVLNSRVKRERPNSPVPVTFLIM